MTKFIYMVFTDDEYEGIPFDAEVDAMTFAREAAEKGPARVEKLEVEDYADGSTEVLNSEVIWESEKVDVESTTKTPEENEFETEFPASDVTEFNGSDDAEFSEDAWTTEELNLKEAVDALEENEDEVECKVCFELGPKAEMKKLDIGYVCPKCAQELQSHQGTNLDLIDKDPFDLEYDDPRDFDEPEEEEVLEEPVDANEVRKAEKAIEEDLKIITDFSSYKPWSGAVDTYELIRDANKLEDLEAYLEELYPDGINETQLNDILWFDGEQVLRDLGLGDTEEDLDEHINDRPADIESDQELHGVDNAVVDCDAYTLVAHSEDEKPLDCKMEKAPLEKPLTEDVLEEDTLTEAPHPILYGLLNNTYGNDGGFLITKRRKGKIDTENVDTVNKIQSAIDMVKKLAKNNDVAEIHLQIVKTKTDILIYKDGKETLNTILSTANNLKANGKVKVGGDSQTEIDSLRDELRGILKSIFVEQAPKYRKEEQEKIKEVIQNKNKEINTYTKKDELLALKTDDKLKTETESAIAALGLKTKAEYETEEASTTSTSADEAESEVSEEEKEKAEYIKKVKKDLAALERGEEDFDIKEFKVNKLKNYIKIAEAEGGFENALEDLKAELNSRSSTETSEEAEESGESEAVETETAEAEADETEGKVKKSKLEVANKTKKVRQILRAAGIDDKTISKENIVAARKALFGESYDVTNALIEEYLDEQCAAEMPFDSDIKVGDKIRIIHLEGEDNSYDGKEGEVEHIDSLGQLHGTWGGLAVIPGVDQYEVITDEGYTGNPAERTTHLEYTDDDPTDGEAVLPDNIEKQLTEETVEEAKKDEEEIPADPEYVKLEVHNILNDLVADEIEAINGYEEAKAEILDAPIEHKDEIVSTIDHVEDEEKEHIDELVDATSEIPFSGEHKEEAPVVEKPVAEEPFDQDFPEVEEELTEAISEEKLTDVEDYLKDADHGSIDFEWENDYDFVNGSILWNKDKEIFEAGLSIYHASEDNNANNPDAHTNEEDYSADTIKELYNYLSEDFGEEFEKAFEEAIKPEDLKEEKAKPEGNKVLSYNKALALANSEGKPVIYGYTNTSYGGKYFEVEPIVCNSVSDETKKFKQQYKSAGTVYVAYPGKSFIESLREDADVDYVEYMHSYCNALEPHMDELRKIEDVEELKKAILDIVNKDPDVNTTHKKNKFTYLIQNKKWSSCANIMAYLDKAMAKAKSIEVKVDDTGELVKEELDPKETQFVFTPEEQEEYNCDEDGNVNDGYDQLCHCGWCGEVYSTSEMRHEVDFGWICSRCEAELKSHGGPLTFIENEELKK